MREKGGLASLSTRLVHEGQMSLEATEETLILD